MNTPSWFLFIWWCLEQGVWLAPILGVGLCFLVPKERRRDLSPLAAGTVATLMSGLLMVFILNAFGRFPDPARVACGFYDGLVLRCHEASADTVLAPILVPRPSGSAGVTDERFREFGG